MKNGFDFCDGFICKDVHKCINSNDKDCSDNCDLFCNCSVCRFDHDVETNICSEKKSTEELMEDGQFWIDEDGNARPY